MIHTHSINKLQTKTKGTSDMDFQFWPCGQAQGSKGKKPIMNHEFGFFMFSWANKL